jgi:AcrR family transcriptional regulator
MTVSEPAITDRRLLRGARTRQAILGLAARVASAEGLEAVSLQRLANELGISKSGLFAHFGSKEELQLATVEEASRIFTEEVLRPGLARPAGISRVAALCDAFISYLERKVFPGGCFFEATIAEFDSRPGPVRDAIVARRGYFPASIARTVRDAQRVGEIDPAVDAEQLAWELSSLLVAANGSHNVDGGSIGFERARRAISDRLERASVNRPTSPR